MSNKSILPYIFLLLLSPSKIIAQPGGCLSVFSPIQTCNVFYLTEDVVFVGQVFSRSDTTIRVGNKWLWEINIVETIPIKGVVPKTTKLFVDQSGCVGSVDVGKKYVFTAHRLEKSDFNSLVSYRWSTDLGDFSDAESDELIRKARAVTKRKKQPSVMGKVYQYNTDPLGIADFEGKSLLTKLGYNPKYAAPFGGIKIFAVNQKGKITQTVTNDNGEFELTNLENGNHKITAVLTAGKDIRVFQYYDGGIEAATFRSLANEKNVYVTNEFCSEDLVFNVRESR